MKYVPVLVDGDEVVNDSRRIRQYLDWKYGEEEQRPEADSAAASDAASPSASSGSQ